MSKCPLVPSHIQHLIPYKPGKTVEEIKKNYDPPRISKLASNENRLGCSKNVWPVVEKAFNGINNYPDPVARKLRAKIAERNGIVPENVILGYGSESLIANLCRTFFGEDEAALTSEHTFANFYVYANVENVPCRKVSQTNDYRFDLPAIAGAITGQTKLIYIANPNNPTGTYISKKEFETFMQQVPDDILVVMDEAYYEYARIRDDYPDSLDYDFDNLLTLRTFSKAYGLAGFRIGYGIGHRNLIDMMLKTKLTFEATALAQVAASAAFDDSAFLEKSREMVEQGKRRLYSIFDRYGISYLPSVANFVMMVLPDERTARNFTLEMLKKGVIVRRLAGFGLPNCIRVTLGRKEEVDHFEDSFLDLFDKIFLKNSM
ncbi:histidinol-phosphate transaminase [Halalkalibaculum sp. DA3122]|uniref:histidinol-phosphate transaminase n=1 Tax=Halalkalibaculum sp. DA3122 TaxID=3373607 RepID=UPI0037545426